MFWEIARMITRTDEPMLSIYPTDGVDQGLPCPSVTPLAPSSTGSGMRCRFLRLLRPSSCYRTTAGCVRFRTWEQIFGENAILNAGRATQKTSTLRFDGLVAFARRLTQALGIENANMAAP